MKVYDYSDLLKVIDNLDVEKEKLTSIEEKAEEDKLFVLKNNLIESGMLEDWRGLVEALKKANVRGCPYPKTLPGCAEFTDSYIFDYRIWGYSSGYAQGHYALTPKGTYDVNFEERIYGHGSNTINSVFGRYGDDAKMERIKLETKIIKDFMTVYPLYREIKLKELYEAIGKKSEEVEKLRKWCCRQKDVQ